MVDVDFSKFSGFIRRTERPFEMGCCLKTRDGRCIGNTVVKGVSFSVVNSVDNHYTISVEGAKEMLVSERKGAVNADVWRVF